MEKKERKSSLPHLYFVRTSPKDLARYMDMDIGYMFHRMVKKENEETNARCFNMKGWKV